MLKTLKEKPRRKSVEVSFQLLAVSFFRNLSRFGVETSHINFKNHSAEKRFFGIIAFRKCQKAESVLTVVKLRILLSPRAQCSIFSCMFYWTAFYLYKAIPLKSLWFHFLRQILDRSVKRQKMPYILKSWTLKLFCQPTTTSSFPSIKTLIKNAPFLASFLFKKLPLSFLAAESW